MLIAEHPAAVVDGQQLICLRGWLSDVRDHCAGAHEAMSMAAVELNIAKNQGTIMAITAKCRSQSELGAQAESLRCCSCT